MNLLLLEPADFTAPDRARLQGRRLEHARTILRAAPGDRLRVGVLGGPCGHARVSAIDRDALELADVTLDTRPPEPLRLSLVVALPRPPSLRRILQAAAAMGVKDIVLLHSARVEKSFWQSHDLQPAAIEEQLRLGLEQGRDTVLPRVELARRFREFATQDLPGRLAGSTGLLAHPEASEACPHACAEPVTLLVGPEGGWVDAEVEALVAAGARAVGIGARVLRVETAVIALLGRIAP